MSKSLKRLNAPKSWSIPRKEVVFTVKPSPGAHSTERGIPLLVLIREILKMENIARDVHKIISDKKVYVDNRVIKDYKFNVGIMDTLYFEGMDVAYRMAVDNNGRVIPYKISSNDRQWKLDRIDNIQTIKGNRTALHMFDGRTILVDKSTKYKTGDVLKISLPDQKILDHFRLEEGNVALIWKGKNASKVGTISKYEIIKSSMSNLIYFKEGFITTKANAYVIGKKVPEISLPEVKVQ
ncbi:MAG: 30S ribosomal protein S4e [Thermoplasmata archaeon]